MDWNVVENCLKEDIGECAEIYDDASELVRYNAFKAKILVRHAKDEKLYLYAEKSAQPSVYKGYLSKLAI